MAAVAACGVSTDLGRRAVELLVELRRCRQSRSDPMSLFPVFVGHARAALGRCAAAAATFAHALADFDAAPVLAAADAEVRSHEKLVRSSSLVDVLEQAIMSERRGAGAIAAALAGLGAGEVEDLDEEAATLLAGARRYCGAAAKVPPPILATDRDVIVAISRIGDPAVRSRVDALWARLAAAEGLLEEPRSWDAGDPPAIAAPAAAIAAPAAVAAPVAAAPPAAAPPAPPAPPANGKPKPVDVAGAISRIAEPEVKAKVSSLFDRLATVERLAP